MIKCGRCGNGNSDEVVFCQFCGTRLVADALSPVADPYQAVGYGALQSGPSGTPLALTPARPGVERGFRLVVVHRDGSDGATYSLLGDQIDIGRSDGDLMFDDPHLGPRHARIVSSANGRILTPL